MGQSLDSLSTGEMQRLKLATGIAGGKGRTLFLLDEPTGGLHPNDTLQLITLFKELVTQGHSILCVTHDEILIRSASWKVELGPGGGRNGGRITG